MKAIEYWSQFSRDQSELGDIKATTNLINGFLGEAIKLKELRRAKSGEAQIAIFKELENKWKCLCRIALDKTGKEIFKPDGYRNFLINKVPVAASVFFQIDHPGQRS